MYLRKTGCGLFVLGAILCSASPASAQELLSFAYSDLSGGFVAGSSLFTAADDFDADGDVTRLTAPLGDAIFAGSVADSGFAGMASFDVSLNVTGITTTMAASTGTITLTDLNGDTFSGNLAGNWENVGGSGVFAGLLSNIVPTNSSGDGTFDGDAGSGFSMSFPVTPPFMGTTVTLEFGNWFLNNAGMAQDFSGATTFSSGLVVPEPATLAMLAIGGLAVAVRRRRKA